MKKSGELATVRPRGTAKQRFEGLYKVNPQTDCWEWQGTTTRGYGIHSGDNNKIVRANRFAYENYVGPIPDGHGVLHKCDNPLCVNWQSHLFTGTQKDNMEDCSMKGRTAGHLGKVKQKITPPMAMNIRVMFAHGFPLSEIAKIYSTHLNTIAGIVKGRTHLTID